MTLRLQYPALALAVAALSCAKESTAPTPNAPPRITALPRALTASEQRIVDADNRLAIKLLRHVSTETRDTLPNLFFSPLSVAMALTMTYNGAAGATEEAMRATLELEGMTLAEVNEGNRSLIELLRKLDPSVHFQIANSIWYRLGVTFEQPFLDATRTYYDARVEGLDFASPLAPQTINNWVNQETNGLIPEIVPAPIPTDIVMYLLNAIYFKGHWTQQFDKNRTAPRPFRLANGTSVDVPTMTYADKGNIRKAWTPRALLVDLAYGGQAFSMTIVLPAEGTTVDEVIGELTLEQWQEWVAGLDSSRAELFLPKFKLQNKFLLNGALGSLGMGIAFEPYRADFRRMRQQNDLYISRVLHNTYVDVNEEGTEAAAVTAVEVGLVCACEPPPIRIDRPFLFALRENLSGTILFMGVIRHPAID